MRSLTLVSAAPAAMARGVPLRVLLRDVLAAVAESAESAGVRIEVADPVPDVQVDVRYLAPFLRKLVDNAIK